MIDDARWFWGQDNIPSREEAEKILSQYDRRGSPFPGGFFVLKYDGERAILHTWLSPEKRSGRNYARIVFEAIRTAEDDGKTEIIGTLIEGSPFLKTGRSSGLGFDFLCKIPGLVIIDGISRDIHVYRRKLNPKNCNSSPQD